MIPEDAVTIASLSHLAICDNYGGFAHTDYDVRVRMIALALGAALQHGSPSASALLDATALQEVGSSKDQTIGAAMAWRAVQGCATVYSRYHFGQGSLEEGMIAPQVIMATHDLFDWRSDTAAGNHENGVSAAYCLGSQTAFHDYLEAMLGNAQTEPRSGAYSIAAVTFMHFTSARYGAWEYLGEFGAPCGTCLQCLRDITTRSGLHWVPRRPTGSFSDGCGARERCKMWVEKFEDHGLVQESLGWFQHLLATGRIWVFDALNTGIETVDLGTRWV
jgi:hypothetical protein